MLLLRGCGSDDESTDVTNYSLCLALGDGTFSCLTSQCMDVGVGVDVKG